MNYLVDIITITIYIVYRSGLPDNLQYGSEDNELILYLNMLS